MSGVFIFPLTPGLEESIVDSTVAEEAAALDMAQLFVWSRGIRLLFRLVY